MDALVGMLVDGSLLRAFWVTLQPLVIGLVASIFIGVPCGVAIGLNKLVEWLSAPLFIIAQTAPLAALIPILTFAYGIGLTSKVLTVCIMALPVIGQQSENSARHTPSSRPESARPFPDPTWPAPS